MPIDLAALGVDPEWLAQKRAELGQALESDKQAQTDEDRRALLMQFAQSYANRRPMPVEPRKAGGAMAKFGADLGLEERAQKRGLDAFEALTKIKSGAAANPDNEPAPAEWGAPAGMSKKQAIESGYAKKDKSETVDVLEPDLVSRAKKAGVPTNGRKREPVIADVLAAERAAADRGDKKAKDAADAKGSGAKDAMDLRKEFMQDPIVKATKEQGQAIARIRQMPDSGFGDIGLVYSIIKMYDPGSAVKEGEIQLSREPTPLLSKLQIAWGKASKGRLLTPDLINDIRNTAEAEWGAQLSAYQPVADEYGRLAKTFGVEPSTVVLNLGFKPRGAPSPKGGSAPKPRGVGSKRTDPQTGETRVWNGTSWVPEGGN